jgi:hypothetical protein
MYELSDKTRTSKSARIHPNPAVRFQRGARRSEEDMRDNNRVYLVSGFACISSMFKFQVPPKYTL